MVAPKPEIEQLAAQRDVEGLIKLLKHQENSVRYRAAGALGKLGADAAAAVPALIEALGDWDPMMRAAAAGALGGIGPDAKEAVSALNRALTDPEAVVRMCADSAIRDIWPSSAKNLSAYSRMMGRKVKPKPKGAAQTLGESLSQEIDPALFYINPIF